MKFRNLCSSLLAAGMLCGTFTTVSSGQAAPQTAAPSALPFSTKTEPLTEDALRSQWQGKLIFLRGSYMGDDLQFDVNGKVKGSPAVASFTLCGLEVRKIHLSKRKLEIEADRYGLHFFGALPYEDDSKPFDKVKISKKPIHITIERELVVIPKVKKTKKTPDAKTQEASDAQTLKTRAGAANPGTAVAAKPPTDTSDSRITVMPAHSAMMMHAALNLVFASDIDQRMIANLPDYWQQYFKSKVYHRQFMPTDPSILAVSDGMTPPVVQNSIDPSSNEYAQKYGIAGLELLRTVVDANGKPQQIAIARPIGFGLDEKAVDAVRNSRFTPALQNGHPVAVVIDVVVTFRIYSNRTRPGSVPKGSKPTVLAASATGMDLPGVGVKMLQ